MVSELKGSPSQAAQALRQAQPGTAPTATPKSDAAPASADAVTVTDLGQRLQKLSESVENLPVVDQNRVSALRESIASGQYELDDQQIAEKLTQLEQQLGTPRSE